LKPRLQFPPHAIEFIEFISLLFVDRSLGNLERMSEREPSPAYKINKSRELNDQKF
jgi:hypothetical protein